MIRSLSSLAMLAALALQGCATTQQAPAANRLPGLVKGVLTTKIRYQSYGAQEMADPATQRAIKDCEQKSSQHCSEYWLPSDKMTSVTIGVDKLVIAIFDSFQVSPGGTFNGMCRFVDPAGSIVGTSNFPLQVPDFGLKDPSYTQVCSMSVLPETATGRWMVEYQVNGEVMSTLRFDVLPAGSSDAI